MGEETPPPENYLCLNPEGEPIASNYLSQSFKQFLREHSLRRSACMTSGTPVHPS